MTQVSNFQSAIDGKIKKLTQLRDLLSDPDIAEYARSLLVAASTDPQTTRRKPRLKHGSMMKAALSVVNKSDHPVSAKEVRSAMEAAGFAFSAANRDVAVSKVLRTLAKKNKIVAEPGAKPKSPILYRRRGVSLVPVRENVQ